MISKICLSEDLFAIDLTTAKAGGDERGRTADLMNAIHALYQLSYIPNYLFQKLFFFVPLAILRYKI